MFSRDLLKNSRALILAVFATCAVLAQAPDPTKARQERDDKKDSDPKRPEKEGSIIRQDGTTAGGAAAPVDPSTFKVGPEDVIEIRVWRETDLSGMFAIRPDGKITLPLSGELNAAGKTLDEIKEEVVKAYYKFILRPEVSVSLRQVGSRKYYLVGEVLRPGVYPLVVPTTILEALNGAGGFKEFANKKRIIVLRGEKKIKFNYSEVISGRKMDQNIRLESGDHVYVP